MMSHELRPIPENWPRGYSWYQILMHDDPRLDTEYILNYAEETTFEDTPEQIVSYIQKFYNNHLELHETPVGWCLKYILDHPEVRPLLKRVGDGSWRKHRLLLKNEPVFDNHSDEKFYETLVKGLEVRYHVEPSTEAEAVAMLKECIEEDDVIFLQYSDFDDEDTNDSFFDYDDEDTYHYRYDEDEEDDPDSQYWDDGCLLEDVD